MIRYYCDRCDNCITSTSNAIIKLEKTGATNNIYEYMLCPQCYELFLILLTDSDSTVNTNRF